MCRPCLSHWCVIHACHTGVSSTPVTPVCRPPLLHRCVVHPCYTGVSSMSVTPVCHPCLSHRCVVHPCYTGVSSMPVTPVCRPCLLHRGASLGERSHKLSLGKPEQDCPPPKATLASSFQVGLLWTDSQVPCLVCGSLFGRELHQLFLHSTPRRTSFQVCRSPLTMKGFATR